MSVREYIGARYVPLFMGAWDGTATYEPLSVVEYQGNSYTSRQYVPANIPITDEAYWAVSGNYNAQVEYYRQEVERFGAVIPAPSFSPTNTVKDYIDRLFNTIASTGAINVLNPPSGLTALDPTGETDNTALLQAMIDSLDSGRGGTIYFPSGLYRFDSTISITHDKITFIGDTFRATTLKFYGESTNFIEATQYSSTVVAGTHNNEAVQFINLCFVSDQVGNICFYVRDQQKFDLTRCFIYNFTTGIDFGSVNTPSVGASKFVDVQFQPPDAGSDCTCYYLREHVNSISILYGGGMLNGAKFLYANKATDVWLDTVNMSGGGTRCVDLIGSDNGAGDFMVRNCLFDWCYGIAVRIYNVTKWGCSLSGTGSTRRTMPIILPTQRISCSTRLISSRLSATISVATFPRR